MDRDQLVEHLRFAQELGVTGVSRDPAWRGREGGQPPPATIATAVQALVAVRNDIGDCTRCKLHGLGRKQIVFGVGNPDADLMFVGEAPGADEDIQGIPFVGRAGQLLTKIIEAIGLTRDDVYIANVIKCRPPQNRNPEPDEVETCQPFLFRQIDIIKPKVIVALGATAVRALTGASAPIVQLRGRPLTHASGAHIVVTYHPSAILRADQAGALQLRRALVQDLRLARKLTGLNE